MSCFGKTNLDFVEQTVLIGPKVQIKAEVKANVVTVRYRIDDTAKSVSLVVAAVAVAVVVFTVVFLKSWDWIGMYHSTQEEQYADYVTWSYIDMNADFVALEVCKKSYFFELSHFIEKKKKGSCDSW
jgi:hypothetical protein